MQIDDKVLKKIESIYKRHKQLEDDLTLEEVLTDRKLTAKIEKEKTSLQEIIDKYENFVNLQKQYKDMSEEEMTYFEKEFGSIENNLESAYQKVILALSDLHGENENITIEIVCKSGDCAKLAKDICDGYIAFCKNNGFDIDIESLGKAGFQLQIGGNNCFGIFKNETGIHKTDYCEILVVVYPAIKKQEVSFGENDIKIDIFRSNGAGGQNVNKVSTAVRIKHLATGIVVTCQDERSQFQNKERALKNLKEKVTQYVNNNFDKTLEKQRKKYFNAEPVKFYNYNNGIVTIQKTKEKFDLQKFLNGKSGMKII